MQVIIKQWPDRSASIISANGQLIWTFSSVQAARQACSDWHNLVDCEPVFVIGEQQDASSSLSSAA